MIGSDVLGELHPGSLSLALAGKHRRGPARAWTFHRISPIINAPGLPFGECMTKAGPTAARASGDVAFLSACGVGALALGAPGGTVVADAVAAEGESTLTRFLDVDGC